MVQYLHFRILKFPLIVYDLKKWRYIRRKRWIHLVFSVNTHGNFNRIQQTIVRDRTTGYTGIPANSILDGEHEKMMVIVDAFWHNPGQHRDL